MGVGPDEGSRSLPTSTRLFAAVCRRCQHWRNTAFAFDRSYSDKHRSRRAIDAQLVDNQCKTVFRVGSLVRQPADVWLRERGSVERDEHVHVAMLCVPKFDHTQCHGHRRQRAVPNSYVERCTCNDCIGRILDIELVEHERDVVYRERRVVGQQNDIRHSNDRGALSERHVQLVLYRPRRLRQSIGDRDGHQYAGPNCFAERCACNGCIGRILDVDLVEHECDVV